MSASANSPNDGQRGSVAQERAEALRRSAVAASEKSLTFLRPRVYQAWCNLRVWLPFFDTPNRRAKTIRYAHNDCRAGFHWDVDLPKQCCRCGRTDNLRGEQFEAPVRAFEYPLHITGIAAMMSAGVLFMTYVASSFIGWTTIFSLLMFTAFIVAAAGALLWMKSWDEDVTLRLFACPDHINDLRLPDMVVYDNELSIVLPSERLAEAAMEELKQRRRGKTRAAGDSSAAHRSSSGVTPPAAIPIDSHAVPARPVVPDLPPIKLAGEDDEDLLPK